MTKKLTARFRGLAALLVLSAGAIAAATIGASEPMAWRFAHPEAQILAGIDFRRLAETADGRQIREQFVAALGAPMLEQAERLLLSSVVESTGKRSDVLILSGSFSLPQLRKLAMSEGAKMMPYKGLEIAAPAGAVAGDPHLAWITGPGGGTTVLIGTRPAIQAAAERSKASVESLASVNPLFARARDLGQKFPVWITCETMPQGFGPKSLDRFAEDGDGPDVGQLDGFDIGIQVARTADLNMWIWTTSEATADVILKELQGAVGAQERFVLSSWLAQLKGSIEESTLVLGAPIAAGTVAERVGPMLVAFALPVDLKAPDARPAVRVKVEANVPMTGMAAMNQPVPAAVPVPPPPPKKLFVRIEGMDEGTKDIPYTAKP
jgi:hypothetical protein